MTIQRHLYSLSLFINIPFLFESFIIFILINIFFSFMFFLNCYSDIAYTIILKRNINNPIQSFNF
jgi:hypothetical protein